MYNSYCLIFKVWIALITIELTTSCWIFHFLINLMGLPSGTGFEATGGEEEAHRKVFQTDLLY